MSILTWVILGAVCSTLGAVLFVLLTDGRYFAKPLVRWIYNRFGPTIFTADHEPNRWHTLGERLQLAGQERILDVGTAVGGLPLSLLALPRFEGDVVGVDWSPRMVAEARAEAARRGMTERAHFEVVDVREGLPFDMGAFDVVICLGLLETLPHPERVLQELRRVLADDGTMVLSLYRGWSSRAVALDLAWYQEHLRDLGLGSIDVIPCRSSHDAVLARSFIE